MFPVEIMSAYIAAVLIVIFAPGPDNILAISRGLSQGYLAAVLSSVGAGFGIMFHTLATTLGLALILQASPVAFWAVKVAGAAYLLWLGYKAITTHSLISFRQDGKTPLHRVFATGLLSNMLNPKPGLFVVAFIPQFVSIDRGPVHIQILTYGVIFAVLTALIFSLLGYFSAQLSHWLMRRPRAVVITNIGAGITFLAAGLSILALERRS
ncbi:MAG: LysE family translocator [Gammaproteobacteria bacterium]|nr:LysE family translocator [Gammaproteobacteria bacterium]